ncbi:hypothetical protein [Desulfatiferula olefinivorans]
MPRRLSLIGTMAVFISKRTSPLFTVRPGTVNTAVTVNRAAMPWLFNIMAPPPSVTAIKVPVPSPRVRVRSDTVSVTRALPSAAVPFSTLKLPDRLWPKAERVTPSPSSLRNLAPTVAVSTSRAKVPPKETPGMKRVVVSPSMRPMTPAAVMTMRPVVRWAARKASLPSPKERLTFSRVISMLPPARAKLKSP